MTLIEYLKSGLNKKAKQGIVPLIPVGDAIPRIIHQTYFSKELPEIIRENIAKLKSLNPNWEYRLYDDDDIRKFISENYGERVLYYFNKINPRYGAARADLFRYLLLYKHGGVYLDIKSVAEKSLDSVIAQDDTFLLSRWKNAKGERKEGWGLHREISHIDGGELQQWFIVSAPGHPFLARVIENVLSNIDIYNPILHDTGKSGTLKLTGPIAYTLAITPLLNLYNHRFVDSENELGFQYSLFDKNDGLSHVSIFRSHYAYQVETIVRLGLMKKVLVGFLQVLKSLRKVFKRL